MTRVLRVAAAAFILAALAPPLAAQPAQKTVLTIYSMRRETQLPVLADRELPRLLKAAAGSVDVYSEYIDVPRFPEPAYQDSFREYLRLKYSGHHLDLIVAVQDVASEFVARHRDELFAGTPVVFAASEPPRIANSTGVRVAVDLAGAVDFATTLQPDLQELFIVNGASTRDKVYEDLARAQLARFAHRLKLTYLSSLTNDDLEKKVAALPDHSAIFYVLFYQDVDGENVDPLSFLDRIRSVANRPIYSWTDSTLGRGVVGGAVRSAEAQIQAIADPSARILRGEPAGTMAVSSPKLYVNQADARELGRWGLAEARLPADTTVLFREPGFWNRYRNYAIAAAVLLALQTALIAALLVHRARRLRAEQRLHASDAKLRASYERIRDIGSRMLAAQDSERTRIARELHDDLGQQIAVLSFDVELLRGQRATEVEVERIATHAAGRLQEIGRTVHNIAHRLHPSRLRLLGLVRALSGMVYELNSPSLTVTFEHDNVPDVIPHDMALHIFRVAQEAVQNAIKHSHGHALTIHLSYRDGRLTLSVADDGAGFDAGSASAERGLGFISMHERLDSVGGSLLVESQPGNGTRIVASVPCGADTTSGTRTVDRSA